MKSKLSDDVVRALREADCVPGWNNRNREIRCFTVPGDFGRGCTLYVVPYRRFAYRRQELATAVRWREQGSPKGTGA